MKKSKSNSIKSNKRSPGSVKTRLPAATSISGSKKTPKITSAVDGIKIAHREFVGSVTNLATGWALTTLSTCTPGYDLSPGSEILFPWLSGIAENFELWYCEKLVIELIPGQATTAAGRTAVAIDYDYDDPIPINKEEFLGRHTVVQASVWEPIKVVVDTRNMHRDMPFKYVKEANRGAFVEPRTTFGGYMMIAIDTPLASGAITYDLWVSYVYQLRVPEMHHHGVVETVQRGEVIATADALCPTTMHSFPARIISDSHPKFSLAKPVVPGSQGVPMMLDPVDHTCRTAAYDVKELINGPLQFEWNAQIDTYSPSDLLNTLKLSTEAECYDDDGVFLGYMSSTLPGSTVGPTNGNEVATANKPATGVWSFFLETLRYALPALRYIVPAMVSLAGATLSAPAKFSSGHRLEL